MVKKEDCDVSKEFMILAGQDNIVNDTVEDILMDFPENKMLSPKRVDQKNPYEYAMRSPSQANASHNSAI